MKISAPVSFKTEPPSIPPERTRRRSQQHNMLRRGSSNFRPDTTPAICSERSEKSGRKMCDPITTCFHPSIVERGCGASFPDSLSPHMLPSSVISLALSRTSMSMPVRVTILSREELPSVRSRVPNRAASSVRTPHRNEQSVYRRRQRLDGTLWGEGSRRLARRGRTLRRESDGREATSSDKKARWRRPISRILSRLGYVPKQG